ncbi:MAG: hypothetical protein K8S15_01465 [Candidatus Aegiribacteria sp.]|nr:hypothetical protein [Candidatus Aegiribacteria sp.]
MYCTRCGKELPEDVTEFCTFCGKSFSEKNDTRSNKLITFAYLRSGIKATIAGISIDEIAHNIANIFLQEGYRLESGSPVNGVYSTGNSVCRILFGGFAKRYKFTINIYQNGPSTSLTISSGMTGMSGGLLGVSRMKKETDRIMNLFECTLKNRRM